MASEGPGRRRFHCLQPPVTWVGRTPSTLWPTASEGPGERGRASLASLPHVAWHRKGLCLPIRWGSLRTASSSRTAKLRGPGQTPGGLTRAGYLTSQGAWVTACLYNQFVLCNFEQFSLSTVLVSKQKKKKMKKGGSGVKYLPAPPVLQFQE